MRSFEDFAAVRSRVQLLIAQDLAGSRRGQSQVPGQGPPARTLDVDLVGVVAPVAEETASGRGDVVGQGGSAYRAQVDRREREAPP